MSRTTAPPQCFTLITHRVAHPMSRAPPQLVDRVLIGQTLCGGGVRVQCAGSVDDDACDRDGMLYYMCVKAGCSRYCNTVGVPPTHCQFSSLYGSRASRRTLLSATAPAYSSSYRRPRVRTDGRLGAGVRLAEARHLRA